VVDHRRDELFERRRRLPRQLGARPRRIADEQVDLGGTEQALVGDHVVSPIETGMAERDLAQLAYRVRGPAGDDEVARLGLLQHPPHRLHVVTRVSPVASRVEVPERERVGQAVLDPRDPVTDLPFDELEPAPRRTVIEQDPGHPEEVVALAVVHRHPVPVELGRAVRRSRVERRRFALWRLDDLAEHLRRAGLVEADIGIDDADRFEDSGHAERGDVAGEHRLREARHHEALRREVVDLGGPVLVHHRDHRALVEQVAGHEGDVVLDVRNALERDGRAAAGHAHHVVALLEQELGQVGTVLAGDAGDERTRSLSHAYRTTGGPPCCLPTH